MIVFRNLVFRNSGLIRKNSMKICSKCISDETIPGIFFDTEGVCNYCRIHKKLELEYPAGVEGYKKFLEIAQKIRYTGRHNKKYDCVVGVSGGCDSSFLLYNVKKVGLRPLAVHFDNTWDSEIAVQNIHKLLKKLDVELYTYVVNNEEYDDIYRSFLKAGVKDIDIPTDIGFITVLYRVAEKLGIKYILDGYTFRTEGIMPPDWVYIDGKYIESVQEKFGNKPLKTFPNLWLSDWLKWIIIKRIRRLRPLNYIDYNKDKVKELLNKKFGWQWYGGKHMENRFTIFTINYFLPTKFNINFPVIELSGLIRSGQTTREEVLKKMQEFKSPDTKEIVQLVKKRLGFTDKKFDEIMRLPKKTYRDYKTYKPIFERYRWFFWLLYKMNLVPQSFYMKYTKK